MPKPKPPFDVGVLVMTKNDLTYLGRSSYTDYGTSKVGTHENFQYPTGTTLMIVGVERTAFRGWKYKFMTPDRGVLDSDYAHFKSWKNYLVPVV